MTTIDIPVPSPDDMKAIIASRANHALLVKEVLSMPRSYAVTYVDERYGRRYAPTLLLWGLPTTWTNNVQHETHDAAQRQLRKFANMVERSFNELIVDVRDPNPAISIQHAWTWETLRMWDYVFKNVESSHLSRTLRQGFDGRRRVSS
jgi:hypothetical protein